MSAPQPAWNAVGVDFGTDGDLTALTVIALQPDGIYHIYRLEAADDGEDESADDDDQPAG